MIKLRSFQKPVTQSAAFAKRRAYWADGCNIVRVESELLAVERLIAYAMEQSRQLAGELGERYAVLRGECAPYMEKGLQGGEIMQLSKRTDECIEAVYRLERKRRELLGEIGK